MARALKVIPCKHLKILDFFEFGRIVWLNIDQLSRRGFVVDDLKILSLIR